MGELGRLAVKRNEELADLVGTTPELMGARIRAVARNRRLSLEDAVVEVSALRYSMLGYADEVNRVGRQLLKAPKDPALGSRYSRMVEDLVELQLEVQGAISSFGLGLRTFKGDFPDLTGLIKSGEEVAGAVARGGGQKRALELAELMVNAYDSGRIGDIAAVLELSRLSRGQRALRITTELFIQSLLSAPSTLVLNGLTPLLTTGYRILENTAGGLIQLGTGQGSELLRQSFGELMGISRSVGDSFRFAKKAARTNQAVIDRNSAASFTEGVGKGSLVRAEALGLTSQDTAGQLVNFIGKGVGLPTRFMRTVDEFVKQLSARGKAYGDLTVAAQRRGLGAEDTAAFLRDGMQSIFFEGQILSQDQLLRRGAKLALESGVTDPSALRLRAERFAADVQGGSAKLGKGLVDFDLASRIAGTFGEEVDPRSALGVAEEVTFTRELGRGSLTGRIQGIVQSHPSLRFFLPFFRTPVNLIKYAGNRAGMFTLPRLVATLSADRLGNAFKSSGKTALADSSFKILRELGDSKTRYEALGRLSLGFGVTAWAIQQAEAGNITGRGPKDPELRAAMQDAGWLPYSIKTTAFGEPGFAAFGRLDPFASMIGLIADMYEYSRLSQDEDQTSLEFVFYGAVFASTGFLTQKSYLEGISQFVELLEDPNARGADVIGRITSAAVPNVLGRAAISQDEAVRELDGLLDQMRSRVPELDSLQLEGRAALSPKRNVLGEVVTRPKALGEDTLGGWFNWVTPIQYREVSDDVIYNEMVSLRHGFSPPKRERFGLDMRDYRRAGNQDAYDRWLQLHGKVKLQNRTLRQELRRMIRSRAYQDLSPVSNAEFESPRVQALRNVIQDYRNKAFGQMIEEFPDYARDLADVQRRRRLSRTSGQRGLQTQTVTGIPSFVSQITGQR